MTQIGASFVMCHLESVPMLSYEAQLFLSVMNLSRTLCQSDLCGSAWYMEQQQGSLSCQYSSTYDTGLEIDEGSILRDFAGNVAVYNLRSGREVYQFARK